MQKVRPKSRGTAYWQKLCQWPGCDYYAVSRMSRGICPYTGGYSICRIHKESFRSCRNDIMEVMEFQRKRERNVNTMEISYYD
jgi:hypothetical protein